MNNDEKNNIVSNRIIEKIMLWEWTSLFIAYLATSIVCFENYSSVIFQGSAYFRYNNYFRIILCYPLLMLICSWIMFIAYTRLIGKYIYEHLYLKSCMDLQKLEVTDKINFIEESVIDGQRALKYLTKKFLFTLFTLIIVWISMLVTVIIALFPSL